MADRHPYSPSPGGVSAAINQFRKSFPTTVTAETLKQLGIAPKNESYVINVLRFVGAIDKEGKQTSEAVTVFSHHNDADFQKDFEKMVQAAYGDLFDLHKDAAWQLDGDKLIAFFRSKDKTTDLVGRLQASTFQLLAGFAGHGSAPPPPAAKSTVKTKPDKARTPKPQSKDANAPVHNNGDKRDIGLTVRIEVNLPPAGDQDTYDRIFRSIRENLLNAK